MVKRRARRPGLKVSGDGSGVVNHAGARLLADLADVVGLTSGLSVAMAPTKQRRRGHDRGEVRPIWSWRSRVGRRRSRIWRRCVISPCCSAGWRRIRPVWRTLAAVDEAALGRMTGAWAQARARAWAAGADPGFYVIDIDATLVGAHSDKEQAAPTWKRGFGFHPLLAYLDATGEALAGVLRPGNAGSGTAADHVRVLVDAVAQLPIDPVEREVIVRADSAGWSHGFAEACRQRQVRFVIGHQLTVEIASVLVNLPKRAWQPAISADGADWRDHAEVAEITHLVGHVFEATRSWPSGIRMIARHERPHPGAQLTFTDVDGHRYQVFVTDLADTDIAYLEALYRGRGRCRTTDLRHQSHRPDQPALALVSDQPHLAATRALRPTTCSLGPNCTRSPAPAWPTRNRNDSATACSTPPRESPAPVGGPTAGSQPTGPGPPTSSPPSTAPTNSASAAEHTTAVDRRPPHRPSRTTPHHPPTLTSHAVTPGPSAHDHEDVPLVVEVGW